MIIIQIKGGLGNQLFQYATARQVSVNQNVALKFDFTYLHNQQIYSNTVRYFELDKLNVNANIASEREISTVKKQRWLNYLLHNVYQERSLRFDKNVFKAGKNCFLSGYFQSEKYFINIRDILLKELTFKEPLLDQYFIKTTETIKNCNSVSLHFRRGDYITNETANKTHGLLPLEYYEKAVKLISEKVKNPFFFVFSDEIEWAKEHFKSEFPVVFVEKSDDNLHSDFRLMSLCKHNIIANSSYSWWAAWLNQNDNKIIISPQKWFSNEQKNLQTSDLIPEKWLRI
jgi:hypothetical protein